MAKTKPPKLDLGTCEDKKEAVELWLDQFNDWCILQGFRDTAKPTNDPIHWKRAHYAMEISAFILALPLDILRMVESTIVPTLTTTSGENDEDTFIGNPWVWQRKLLFSYAGQDTVLAERMNFIETCKQKLHESIAEFESRFKYHGSKCEYNKMTNPEQELIRDRFVTEIHNDKLRAELLRHKKDDGTVDHYSDFIELDELDNTLSSTVIKHSKSHFAHHGIPEVLLSDNGPQFVSTEFAAFCDLYGITHITSSPYWPRGNEKAESAVKIVKTFMKKCADIQLALLTYRNTPQEGHSLIPAQRSMGRRTRLKIPVSPEVLGPDKVVSTLVQSEISLKREKAKKFYDRKAGNEHPNVPIESYVYSKPCPRNRSSPWQCGQVGGSPRQGHM